MATKLVLHTDRISEEQQVQVDQLLNKIVPADIPVEKYNHLIELPWQGIYPDMESNSAWLQKLSLLIKETTENIEFNFRLLIDENKLVLQVGLETTQEQMDAINALFGQVLPVNLVTEMEWIDGLPLDYTRAYYLESTGTQYICAKNISIDTNDSYNYKSQLVHTDYIDGIWGTTSNNLRSYTTIAGKLNLYGISFGAPTNYKLYLNDSYQPLKIELNKDELLVNGVQYTSAASIEYIETDKLYLFTQFVNGSFWHGEVRFYYFTVKGKHNFVPALNPSGIPGMYDTVSGEFKTNEGTGQFAIGLTMQQVKDMRLPAPVDVNTLLLSLSCDVYNDTEAWNAIENARSSGWEFTFLWNNVTEYLTPRIDAVVGTGNYTMSYNYAAGTLDISVNTDVSPVAFGQLQELLAQIVPSDITQTIMWSDGMPTDYMRGLFLKGDGNQFINTSIYPDVNIGCSIETEPSQYVSYTLLAGALSNSSGYGFIPLACYSNKTIAYADKNGNKYPQQDGPDVSSGAQATGKGYKASGQIRVALNYMNSGRWDYEDEVNTVTREIELDYFESEIYLFARHYGSNKPGNAYYFGWDAPIYAARFSEDNSIIKNYVPALNPSGIPGMYDTVSGEFKTNDGIEQFVIGMTLDQVISLKLPPAPAEPDNKLPISVPGEAQYNTAAQNALEAARANGWVLEIKYRDIETPEFQEYAVADYIAKDVEQNTYINTGLQQRLLGYYKIWVQRIPSEAGFLVDKDGVRYYTKWCSTMLTPDGSTPADHGYELHDSMDAAIKAWGLTSWVNPVATEDSIGIEATEE